MTLFDSALRTIVNSAMGIDIVYQPAAEGAQPVPLRALSATPDVESDIGHNNRIRQQRSVFEILAADLAAPVANETFTAAGVDYRVMSVSHKDQDRVIWLIEAAPCPSA